MKKFYSFFLILSFIGQITAQKAVIELGTESWGKGIKKLYIPNKFVAENNFIKNTPQNFTALPTFIQIKDKLPIPIWKANNNAIVCYWKAWEIAFSNLHTVSPENGFVSPYIDAAFNGNIFMWDTAFMTLFGRYGSRAFNFQGSLDNFYSKQKPDGFICRQIYGSNGEDCFERYDPSSTGPNILPWSEWEYYTNFNDKVRLAKVFPALLAYYNWFNLNRSWKDGTYYSTGWGCGMDNQPRLQSEYSVKWSNGQMSWIDTTLQEIFAARFLIKMAVELDRENDVKNLQEEVQNLTKFVNEKMWNEKLNFYTDVFKDGSLSNVQSIGSYWALLADVVPENRVNQFISPLSDPKKFNRPHRVPTLSADSPDYNKDGGYWRGSVWAPTSYMVLRGLTQMHQDSLAHEIATNHFDNVLKVYNQTGTFFENYSPEKIQGNDRKNFVGWTGLTPIAVLFEYIFGIRADVPHNKIIWDVTLKDEFGVKQYPFGTDGIIDFYCKPRKDAKTMPQITVKSNNNFTLTLLWAGGKKDILIKGKKYKTE